MHIYCTGTNKTCYQIFLTMSLVFNYIPKGVEEDSWESLGLQGDTTSPS